jgi:hypothetical protein
MNDPVIFSSVIITLALLGNLLLALWVYADAKAKGIKKSLCILFFIVTWMNSSGFIAYIVIRNFIKQKNLEVVCPQCHAGISNDVKFCPNCGVVHVRLDISLPKKPKKHLLVAGIALIVIVFALALIPVISNVFSDSSRSLSSTMCVKTKYGNTWKMRFRTADGIGYHTFKVKGDGYGLIYSSDITEGEMKIDFCDEAGNVITEIPLNISDTLRNVENGKKYKVVVTADKAKKGSFSFIMKDLKT